MLPLRDLQRCNQFTSAEHLRQLLAGTITSGLLSGGAAALAALNSATQKLAAGDSPHLAVSLFDAIRNLGMIPDDYTFTFAIKAISRLRNSLKGRELHSLSLKLGFCSNLFVQNSLISMYFVFLSPENAAKVFELMPERIKDVVSLNSMMSGYIQNGNYRETISLFCGIFQMGSSIVPDTVTYINSTKACSRIGYVKTGRSVHAAIVNRGVCLDFYLGSALIDMYSKCGEIFDAMKVFDEIPERNSVCWSAMISGYLHLGFPMTTVEFFREMQIAGVKPDEAAVCSVLSACGQIGALSHGSWIHSLCGSIGLEGRLRVKNALIDMYSKCGEIERAQKIFYGMEPQRDVFSWTGIIFGLAVNGKSAMALDYFTHMEKSSMVSPNGVTFLAVLTACSHGGFVEEGLRYFDQMIHVYEILPEIQHYGCMVDLLGRAKLLTEMELFVRKMPMAPDAIIWRSMIFACKDKRNVEVGEMAAGMIMELEEREGVCRHGSYIGLANLYASAERWEEVGSTRRGVVKKPGCSSIEINGMVFEFFASACHHGVMMPCEILQTLKE